MATTKIAPAPIDMKREVVVLGVSDVDRAKAFYENLVWRLSEASIIFGKGVTSAKPGSTDSLTLAVDDVDAARDDLIARGVDVSEVFHDAPGASSTTPGRTHAPNGAVHAVKNVCSGNAAERATYIVEKGKPLLVPGK